MGADFEYAWPTADISFVAPEVAANIVHGRKIQESADPEKTRREAVERMRLGSAPWRAAALHYLDDVIDPRETRATLIRSLEIARGKDGRSAMSERRLCTWPTTL